MYVYAQCRMDLDDGRLVMMGHFGNEFTTILYLIDEANYSKNMIRVLSEDIYALVLLICWVYREEMEYKVQMERWDMTMLGHSVCSNKACPPSVFVT